MARLFFVDEKNGFSGAAAPLFVEGLPNGPRRWRVFFFLEFRRLFF
jgi:hypothetical protein